MSLGAGVPLQAQSPHGDSLDGIAATRRLRQQAASAAPTDTGSGITRDIGSIAVIEHNGSNYDWREADGTPNYAARTAVAQRFYQSHGDLYDFLVVFTNFEFETGSVVAFHNLVRNDVRGIGKPIADGSAPFGSSGKLQGYVDMASLDRYRRNGFSLDPADLGFVGTLNVVAHEVGHQWLAEVRYRDALGGASSALLGESAAHWSYLLDSDASLMYGSDWAPDGTGMFKATRVRDGYSALDLYLMGFLDAQRVGPITLLKNPAVDPTALPLEGATVAATTETVRIDQIIAEAGERSPDHRVSPKTFRLGFVFLTAPGVEPAPDDLAAVERVRQAFASHFFALTRGVAIADTALAEGPPTPHASTPDLEKALSWLLSRQSADGGWEDAPATRIRDTATAMAALVEAGQGGGLAYQRALQWALVTQPANLDFAGRRASALALQAPPGLEPTVLATGLLAQQNRDGGFGAAAGYESDPLDTALVLRALSRLGRPLNAPVRRALLSLGGMRSPMGGWPGFRDGDVSSVATAQVLLALQDWSPAPEAQSLMAPGLAALLARRNIDGGFGESPSTPYATALALQVVLRAGASPDVVNGAIGWLQGSQLLDGSWEGSSYQTALVLSALEGGVAPNLTVPPDSLLLDPPSAREGEMVRVTARVRNSGRRAAGPSRARLHDGEPGHGSGVSEAAVPGLGPGEEAEVGFDMPTMDRPGDHTLFVVADADGQVTEAREDDNATTRALHVEGWMPDLAVTSWDIVVSPMPPEEGELAQVAVTVRNLGQRDAASSTLSLLDGDPRQGGRLIGQAEIPSLAAGQVATLLFPWDTTGARGQHVLFAVADARYAVRESDELNNEASLPVEIRGPQPPGPDLELGALALLPASLSTIPQAIEARLRVRNLGRDGATSSVALYDSDPASLPLARQVISLGPRSETTVTLQATVVAPGTRTLVAVADPDGTLPEANETNNQVSTVLIDPQNTLDVEVLSGDVTTSPGEVMVGEQVLVSALVRNRGTAPVSSLPVLLAHPGTNGLAELVRTAVSLAPGATTIVTFRWTTSLAGDPVPLAVVADPFDLLDEFSETNNRADFSLRVRSSALSNLSASGDAIAFDPDPPLEGSTALVSALVRNASPVGAGPFRVRFYRGDPDAGGRLIGETALDGLAALSSIVTSVTWSPVDARGAQGVFVVADPMGELEEYDETDNRAFRPLGVLGLPDLVLTVGDVSLVPGYPRSGEPVKVRATVRNLGGQATSAAVLRAFEGEPALGTPIGESAIPPLAPGQSATLDLDWTPAAPPGERSLSLLADADDTVREQDEGNNRARLSVVVQDADLYLTEPYFSPDGDGVKDETRLAYRSSGAITVVISNSRGQKVRTLAEAAPASGFVAWNGRDDKGRLLWDGTYTVTLTGEGGVALGRVQVVLDTNRSPIHDAAGTGMTAISNLTCRLPDIVGPAWMPGEDEALFTVDHDQADFPAGLLRVALDGTYSYVTRDPGYEWAFFGSMPFPYSFALPSAQAVSPDGREVLIRRSSEMFAVDLVTGSQRPIPYPGWGGATWSPDGRWIATLTQVLARDGSVVAEPPTDLFDYGGAPWAWSPDGAFVAKGNVIARRDGSGRRTIPLPDGLNINSVLETVWRGDGKIYVRVGECWDSCLRTLAFLIDPEAGTATPLPWLADKDRVSWSPDGGKVLYREPSGGITVATVARADGSLPRHLVASAAVAAPHGTAASFLSEEAARPGQACYGQGTADVFGVSTLQNLTAQLNAVRLPANNGILLRGSVSDLNLDHYQIEYADQTQPEIWHPIGAASDVPLIDDVLGVFVPSRPGTYLLRLRAEDRAGNVRSRTRVVAWDRVPSLANVTQTEFLISPNGDGIQDSVTFNYLVVEPTRLEVRVVGPENAGATAPTVRRFSLEYPTIPGPGDPASSFTWDGRDEQGQTAPDGRYEVLVNDMPFHVDVDATPPEVDWAWDNPRGEATTESCPGGKEIPSGLLVADRLWHVVDPHLKRWQGPGLEGAAPVYEPARDAAGQIVYEAGVPRVQRIDGRVVGIRQKHENPLELNQPGTAFIARDLAGNASTVSIGPVAERLLVLQVATGPCQVSVPPINLMLLPQGAVARFRVAETLLGPSLKIRLQYRPAAGGQWAEVPTKMVRDGYRDRRLLEENVDFGALGIALGQPQRGRFVAEGQAGEVYSEEFSFQLCDQALHLAATPGRQVSGADLQEYQVRIDTVVPERLTSATVTVTGRGSLEGFASSVALDHPDPASFTKVLILPRVGCDRDATLVFSATARGESGRLYRHDGRCATLVTSLPDCPFGLAIEQSFAYCDGSPDRVDLTVSGVAATDASVTVERGPGDAPVSIGAFPVSGSFIQPLAADVADLLEGDFQSRGRLTLPDGQVSASAVAAVTVDRTPAVAEVVEPSEGAQVCTTPDPSTGREQVRAVVSLSDAGAQARFSSGEWRLANGPWTSLKTTCDIKLGEFSQCGNLHRKDPVLDFPRLATASPAPIFWDTTGLSSGDYSLRLTFCDRAGNRTTTQRSLSVRKESPNLSLIGISSAAFSPNADSRLDDERVTVGIYQALRITTEVRDPNGVVVRTLAVEQPQAPGNVVFGWDGRDAAGQVVPDGSYVVAFAGGDACGQSGRLDVGVEVDTIPPAASITVPAAGDTVGASLDVSGTAFDQRFASFVLTYGAGANPTTWLRIAGSDTAVPGPTGLLGQWDTPRNPGLYTLRLIVLDAAGNEAQVRVPVSVLPRTLLDRFTAAPTPFSPNGDGRRDTTTIAYQLGADGKVTVEVRSGGVHGPAIRRLETGVARAAGGLHELSWDGTTDAGVPAPDGDYTAWIRAEDPVGGSPQEESLALILDRVPPAVDVLQPAAGGFSNRNQTVLGSITDPHFGTFAISVTQGLDRIQLANGGQQPTDPHLATLTSLADGPHTLTALAEDAAENRGQVDIPFTVDSVPPLVRLGDPAPAAALSKGPDPISITGTASDDNFKEYRLSFGPGEVPAAFVEIARSSTAGSGPQLGAWSVASIPDGTYTLQLIATDKAGNESRAERRTVTLDGTVPAAAIASPAEGGYLRASQAVTGTATDANLEAWELESAPGPAASAYQWSPVASGASAVEDGPLATGFPLPPDGVHSLRLTVRDRAGHVSRALRTVTVDTMAPAIPSGLAAVVARSGAPTADVQLNWNAGSDPDLAGYKVSRDDVLLTTGEPIVPPSWNDGARPEGRYRYSVVAVDRAGNLSPPATIEVRVDLTPPLADILSPAPGASLSGSVDVRGSAFSPDDFKEYRLLVGVGASPTAWTPVKRSALSVSAGVLGTWTAAVTGPHVLALEAEDTAGNQARVEVPVTVDNDSPVPPVLRSVTNTPVATSITCTWDPSPSADVTGYLVYRNGRLANAPGIVLGDLGAFLVPAPSYGDTGLPDGRRCYRIVAMDRAGNLSPPSNELCQALDNRAPQATIVAPADGARFEFPVHVVALTPDLDVASVRFELKRHADTAWTVLGPPDTAEPFEATLDPAALALAFGDYDLRATATDQSVRTDPAPAVVTVTYGDATPPAPPENLAAHVDGMQVGLTWDPNTESDLAGYLVQRDDARLTPTPIPQATFSDSGVSVAFHAYQVVAVDRDGNQSPPATIDATPYGLSLDAPYPVTGATSATLTGRGSRPGSTIQVLRGDTIAGFAPAAADVFRVEGVALVDGPNVLRAFGTDDRGNRSLPSDEILLIANAPPASVTGLAATVTDHDVALTWDATAEADVYGYLVRRGDTLLTPASAQTATASIAASAASSGYPAAQAFDGDAATVWIPPGSALPATWSVVFPTSVLMDRAGLKFADASGTPTAVPDYRIEARWEGRFLPLAMVHGNTEAAVEHRWPTPLATDALRVVIESGADLGLAEVAVSKIDAVPAGTPAFQDLALADGTYTYQVSAIDRYGFEGPAAPAEVAVGDVVAPAAPTGLTALVELHDVLLSWTPSLEPDVVRYVVLRDGVRIAATPAPGHRDVALLPGDYRYTVLAVDAVANESGESVPAFATVSGSVGPPAAPIIAFPTDAAHPVTLDALRSDVRGLAAPGTVVSLDVNGTLSGTARAVQSSLALIQTGGVPIMNGTGGLVASPDGRFLASAWEDDTGGAHTTLVDTVTGAQRELIHPEFEAEVWPLAFSPDGRKLCYWAGTYADPAAVRDGFYLVDLATDIRTTVDDTPELQGDAAWSADGLRMAFTSWSESEAHLWARSLDGASAALLATVPAPQAISLPRWSPDGTRIAFIVAASDSGPYELRTIDVASGSQTTWDTDVWPGPAEWSPDGSRLAYTASGSNRTAVIRELASGLLTPVDDGRESFNPRFDPSGSRLTFARIAVDGQGTRLRSFMARELGMAEAVQVGTPLDENHPNALLLDEWLADGRLALSLEDGVGFFEGASGSFELLDVALSPGENVLVARSTDADSGLTGPDSRPVHVMVAGATFPDLTVAPDGLAAYPVVPLLGQPTAFSARVQNLGGAAAHDLPVTLALLDAAGTTVVESQTRLADLPGGGSAFVNMVWTPTSTGTFLLHAQVDADDAISEAREDNNQASRGIFVAASGDLVAAVLANRVAYPARTVVAVEVSLEDAGLPFQGTVRTTIEDAGGREVAVADSRDATLEYGSRFAFTVLWSTGVTYAGDYAVRVRATDATGGVRAQASWAFTILPDVAVGARLMAVRSSVTSGDAAAFAARVENRGANAPLDGLSARLSLLREGGIAAGFESQTPLPRLLPGGLWEGMLTWPSAAPSGSYAAAITVIAANGSPLATAQAPLTVTAPATSLAGTLTLGPADILAGGRTDARLSLTNSGATPLTGRVVAVEITAGVDPTALVRETVTLDLAAGATREETLSLAAGTLAVGTHPTFLRVVEPGLTLDRALLRVHGIISPPSVDSPADGSTVDTSHPTLCVNNASIPGDAALSYEFQVFADAALGQPLPGTNGLAQTPGRTCWRVQVNLAEDAWFWWRARASDGFSASAFTPAGAFKVDARNEAPAAPLPDRPLPGARVAFNPPTLIVANAQDPELDPLTYEFRLATDDAMAQVVASAAGVPEGSILTSWRVPIPLVENATYYWSARATDGRAASPWSPVASFTVDVTDESPTAPRPLRPLGGSQVPTLTPEVAVGNSTDPEGRPLMYVFQVDRVPSFDSPALQVSPAVPETAGETAWTPAPLEDDTLCYWRSAASDGVSLGPWAGSSFFVNLANDPPGVPVPVDPADGQVVTTLTPSLRVRNAADPDRDVLTYDFAVTDPAGNPVASVAGVPEAAIETSWTVTPPLTEDSSYRWMARAHDATVAGDWSASSTFRVNAVLEPPTAPAIVAPIEGQVLAAGQVTLVLGNATSVEGASLSYVFELYAVDGAGVLTLIERADRVPEGPGTTSWASTLSLSDGSYAWRGQAADSIQTGPWTPTAHFSVRVDVPPAPPSGIAATPGDGRVTLTWNPNGEADVTGYRVYRSSAPGGPYDPIAIVADPSFVDTGLVNGTTVYYVVTALDAQFESTSSAEVAATPVAPPAHLGAEVRFLPRVVPGECLIAGGDDGDDDRHDRNTPRVRVRPQDGHHDDERECPRWLLVSIELPSGFDPGAIDPATVRLGGSVPADAGYGTLVDTDGDGTLEKRVRFRFSSVAPLLVLGPNRLVVTGLAARVDFLGSGPLEVTALRVDLRLAPRTLSRVGQGADVEARLSFHRQVSARAVDTLSLRFNESVPVRRVVSVHEGTLTLKFDRAAVIAVLPVGDRVAVTVKGTVRGLPFTARDVIRVIE